MKLLLPNTKLPGANASSSRLMRLMLLSGLLISSVLVYWFNGFTTPVSIEQIGFLLLGVTGAIFANSTGAGGGVVFIPIFGQMGLSDAQAISTSFGIQCFGMTAGAITWCRYYSGPSKFNRLLWQDFLPIITLCAVFSVLGIWHNYGAALTPPAALHNIFGIFSILLGSSILATIYWLKPGASRNRIKLGDALVLAAIAYAGGIITAWLSVGVGEIVAFYLILRRFDVTMAVAAAVVISAITVWSAAPQHFWFNSHANWQVLAFAGPGAILGGILARKLVVHMSARRLKIFFGIWLLIIGFAS